ncbi:hypothetical protein BFW38_02350 [Terasakiispira papahanaumokuakeensis]|uniref:Lipoprotein LPP20-like domain-containing protein n=1 Tax=Terasakiispira papahanaumokuakeensis TaxID=197479 RepID=A0A1E2V6E8_9GAMM|nr:LPP20 family lipoprotein [Terasakiispira papahanaumokuakeensis]ODC02557.1 hypothetical protein BFW38_02350 [Terasakiispira papahanaumokuakeensis]
MSKIVSLALLVAVTFISGCAHQQWRYQNQPSKIDDNPIVVRATGYGTSTNSNRLNSSQRKLMAMRASKLDAYRALAERVYGIRVEGSSTVESLAARDDDLHAYVDSIVRGAKVISTYALEDGAYETTLELVLEPVFTRCLSSNYGIVAHPNCTVPSVHGKTPHKRAATQGPTPTNRYYID